MPGNALGLFEKYLTLWVLTAMIIGFLLGKLFPEIGLWIEILQIGDVSIPMGVCLFLLMYPTMVSIEFRDIVKAARSPKPIMLTLMGNWVIAPALMTLLAQLFLSNYPRIRSWSNIAGYSTVYGYGSILGSIGAGRRS